MNFKRNQIVIFFFILLKSIFNLLVIISTKKNVFKIFFVKYDSKCKNIFYFPGLFSLDVLSSEEIFHTFHLFDQLSKIVNGKITLTRKIPKNLENKNIFFSPYYDIKVLRKELLKYNLINDKQDLSVTDHYIVLCKYFNRNLARSYPSLHEVSLWENKLYMHQYFDEHNIKTPKTLQINIEKINYKRLSQYFNSDEFLIKDPNSAGGSGIKHIKNENDLINIKNENCIKSDKLLVQKLIKMTKDLRVVLVDKKIVLHYWRENLSKHWQPTSTKFGSQVDFEFFPEHQRDIILHTFKKLKVTAGAFDICWENDDLNTEPIFLEVSTKFQPNSDSRGYLKKDETYAHFRKKYYGFNRYTYLQNLIIKKVQTLVVKKLLKDKRLHL